MCFAIVVTAHVAYLKVLWPLVNAYCRKKIKNGVRRDELKESTGSDPSDTVGGINRVRPL